MCAHEKDILQVCINCDNAFRTRNPLQRKHCKQCRSPEEDSGQDTEDSSGDKEHDAIDSETDTGADADQEKDTAEHENCANLVSSSFRRNASDTSGRRYLTTHLAKMNN